MDSDLNDTFTFTLTDNAGGRFKIEGGKLLVADGSKLDFETAKSHQIKVQVKDAGGLTFEKTFTIGVNDGIDAISGSKRNDKIFGTEGADFINGGAGNDKIFGLGGDDIINGGLGKDHLTGGAGRDTFMFDSALRKGGFDMVTDFNSADDTLQFNLSALKSLKIKAFKQGKLQKKFFTIGNDPKDKNDYVYYNKKNGVVYLDADGSGNKKGMEILKLKPGTKISADDFLFI
jgi:Ca2+-binding RTX toxin-like protein